MKMSVSKFLIAAGMLCLASSSMAQWLWIDLSGRKVFSDRPPPENIPNKNIIKQPGVTAITVVTDTEDGAQSPKTPVNPASTTQAQQLSPKEQREKDAAEQKKKQEEETRRKAEDKKVAKIKADNCQRARTALATLKTGMRLSTVDSKGEPTFMDDKNRAAEEKRLNDVIAVNCK